MALSACRPLGGQAGCGRCAKRERPATDRPRALPAWPADLVLAPAATRSADPVRARPAAPGRVAGGGRQTAFPGRDAGRPPPAADRAGAAAAAVAAAQPGAHAPAGPGHRRRAGLHRPAGHARRLPAPAARAAGAQGLRSRGTLARRPGLAADLPAPAGTAARRGLHADAGGRWPGQCPDRVGADPPLAALRPCGRQRRTRRTGALPTDPPHRPQAPAAGPDERAGPAHRRRPHLPDAAARAGARHRSRPQPTAAVAGP